MDVFRDKLASLEDVITGVEGELIVDGNINTKASDWGPQHRRRNHDLKARYKGFNSRRHAAAGDADGRL